MKAVVQRVNSASVHVDGKSVSAIGRGLMVLAGFGRKDEPSVMENLASKIARLRIFPDGGNESSVSVKDVGGEILLVSQFTLYGDVRKGLRPSFSEAMPAEEARKAYEKFAEILADQGVPLKLGVFQASMQVRLENDGPYTILMDSDERPSVKDME
jgi:D-aminoacyl-tRNA deacylase